MIAMAKVDNCFPINLLDSFIEAVHSREPVAGSIIGARKSLLCHPVELFRRKENRPSGGEDRPTSSFAAGN